MQISVEKAHVSKTYGTHYATVHVYVVTDGRNDVYRSVTFRVDEEGGLLNGPSRFTGFSGQTKQVVTITAGELWRYGCEQNVLKLLEIEIDEQQTPHVQDIEAVVLHMELDALNWQGAINRALDMQDKQQFMALATGWR